MIFKLRHFQLLALVICLFSIGCWAYIIFYLNRTSNAEIKQVCPSSYWETTGTEVEDEWVTVPGAKVYYFSAYLDNKDVVLVAIVEYRRRPPSNISCRFFKSDGLPFHFKSQGTVQYLPEHDNHRYAASFVRCKLPSIVIPHGVALIREDCIHHISYVSIRQPSTEILRSFTVCVSPLHGFDRGNELVEMIELNRILGANYFIFYNFSDAPNVDKLLKHYMDLGIAKVIQWHLPFNVSIGLYRKSNEIHYYGQVAVLNDCMYRNKGSSQFVVNQDIDEFIIPRMHNNWKQMIDALPKNLKSFIFQSTYFRKDWPDVNGTFDGVLAKKYMSITLPKQSRETGLFPVKIKSKYIVRPECVKIAGIHVVHQYTKVKKCQDYLVNVDQGLLHHYRSKVERVEVNATVDTRIENFKDKLLENLKEKWTELKHVPMTIPKTTTPT